MSGISKIMQSGILIHISIRLYKAAGKIILPNYPFTYKMVYWFKNKTKMLKPSVAANRTYHIISSLVRTKKFHAVTKIWNYLTAAIQTATHLRCKTTKTPSGHCTQPWCMEVFQSHNIQKHVFSLYFFPGLFFTIFSYFCSFMVVWGLGFLGWGSYIGFLRYGCSVIGIWGLRCGAFWVFGNGALYINIKE